jgi:peptidoglycan/LPS O-acetylase OafA/YrhL
MTSTADSVSNTTTSSSTGEKPHRSPVRGDIQGLRMLAVFAVIFDHMMAWPSGGFVGVDVFFVISGFLITGILLREHEKTHHISFVNFYQRRIKRIVPVATVVLVLTVVAAYFLFNSVRYMQTFWDAVWAFFFAANWHFAIVGTDYFQAGGPVSPLQHFWSLSVEEQFYFVWPWVMLAVLSLAGLGGRAIRRRVTTGVIMIAIVAGSFYWAMLQSASNPTVAYFSTFTRAWELGIGALIAISSPWWGKIPGWLRLILGWIGFLGIVASYFVINDTLPFPAPWAMMPVLATALVIIAGTGGEQRHLYPLTNPVSKYLGDISYSLYLWHFPIIIFAGTLVVDPNLWVYYPALLAGIILISVFSYHLLERPIQQMPFWTGPASARAKKANWATWREKFGLTYKLGGLSLLAVTVGCLAAVAVVNENKMQSDAVAAAADAVIDTVPTSTPTPALSASPASAYGPAMTSLQREIGDALKATAWPTLNPSLETVTAPFYYVKPEWKECTTRQDPALSSDCSWNSPSATKKVLLLGDSASATYIEAFRALGPLAGWNITSRATIGCPLLDFSSKNCPGGEAVRRQVTMDMIKQTKPDIVILTSYFGHKDDAGQPIKLEVREPALEKFLTEVSPYTKQVVVLPSAPPGDTLAECYTPSSKPSDCASTINAKYQTETAADRKTAEKLGAKFVGVELLFCQSTRCPSFVGQTATKTDAAHITPEYSSHIGPALLELLNAAGVK